MRKTVTAGRTLRGNGAGRAGDHSVGLTPGAGQTALGKGGPWESPGWQCSSRGARQGRWAAFEPTVSSEETASPMPGPVPEPLLSSVPAESGPWEAWSPHTSADRFQTAAAAVLVNLSATHGYG